MKYLIPLFLIIIVIAFSIMYNSHEKHADRYNLISNEENRLPRSNESLNAFKYYRFNNELNNAQSIALHPCFAEVFDNHKDVVFKEASSSKDANVIFFENLTYIELVFDKLTTKLQKAHPLFIYGFKGIDKMAGKNNLYNTMKGSISSDEMNDVFPKTFVLPNDYKAIEKHFAPGNIYILKSNQQRQQNNQITNNLEYIKHVHDNETFVVCQELLQDPLLVSGHKINIRIYMVVLLRNRKAEFYMFNNGFIYYTPKPFRKHSVLNDENITTGYIDRSIYENNPLTLQDLQVHIGEDNSTTLTQNIIKTLSCVKHVYADIFVRINSDQPGDTKFMILGCDIAPDSNHGVKLMEVNKGPDLSYKDDRDKKVKYNLVRDVIDLALLDKKTPSLLSL